MDRVVRRTQWRLAGFTLLLVAALLLGVGAATALVAIRLMDDNVNRALESAAATATKPDNKIDEVDHAIGLADTFVLFVDQAGSVVANPFDVELSGLPDTAALTHALETGRDERDATYDGVHVRLLTVPGPAGSDDDHEAGTTWVQVGYQLTLHERQQSQLLWTISVLSLMGLLGAAIVTWLITRRALIPVRAAFATERRFVASASHELRTPVAIVRASAEILDREALVVPEGQPFVADIVSETDRLGRLIGDMLALASVEAGAITVERHPVELVRWLGDLAHRAESMAGARAVVIRTDLPKVPSMVVEADEDRLTQVLLILVDNAVEHSPVDGTVTLGLGIHGGQVAISVADQGPGIPVSERERIFEPFERLTRTRRSVPGSGLGLAIARQLVERHNGKLLVEDAPGGGARFVLRLPRAPAGAAGSPRANVAQATAMRAAIAAPSVAIAAPTLAGTTPPTSSSLSRTHDP